MEVNYLNLELINNYDNLCRLCANQENINLNIYEYGIQEMLAECTPVPVSRYTNFMIM